MARDLTSQELSDLEELIDSVGTHNLVAGIARICGEKADHIRVSYDDKELANDWARQCRYWYQCCVWLCKRFSGNIT